MVLIDVFRRNHLLAVVLVTGCYGDGVNHLPSVMITLILAYTLVLTTVMCTGCQRDVDNNGRLSQQFHRDIAQQRVTAPLHCNVRRCHHELSLILSICAFDHQFPHLNSCCHDSCYLNSQASSGKLIGN